MIQSVNLLLKPSRLFFRIIILLYVFALYSLWIAGLAWPIQTILTLLMLYVALRFYQDPSNALSIDSIFYQEHQWRFMDNQQRIQCYDKVQILMDIGLFYLLACYQEGKKKIAVIFIDQLTSDEHRKLRILTI